MFFHDYSKFSHQYFVVLNNIHTFAVKKERRKLILIYIIFQNKE